MRIDDLEWTLERVDHIAQHAVTPQEVEEVLRSAAVFKRGRKGSGASSLPMLRARFLAALGMTMWAGPCQFQKAAERSKSSTRLQNFSSSSEAFRGMSISDMSTPSALDQKQQSNSQ